MRFLICLWGTNTYRLDWFHNILLHDFISLMTRWTILKNPYKSKPFIIQLLFFFGHPCGLQDLSSQNGDWPRFMTVKAQSPNHWTTREFPKFRHFKIKLNKKVQQEIMYIATVWLKHIHCNYIIWKPDNCSEMLCCSNMPISHENFLESGICKK